MKRSMMISYKEYSDSYVIKLVCDNQLTHREEFDIQFYRCGGLERPLFASGIIYNKSGDFLHIDSPDLDTYSRVIVLFKKFVKNIRITYITETTAVGTWDFIDTMSQSYLREIEHYKQMDKETNDESPF